VGEGVIWTVWKVIGSKSSLDYLSANEKFIPVTYVKLSIEGIEGY